MSASASCRVEMPLKTAPQLFRSLGSILGSTIQNSLDASTMTHFDVSTILVASSSIILSVMSERAISDPFRAWCPTQQASFVGCGDWPTFLREDQEKFI